MQHRLKPTSRSAWTWIVTAKLLAKLLGSVDHAIAALNARLRRISAPALTARAKSSRSLRSLRSSSVYPPMAMHPVIWLGKLGFLKCPSFPFVSARMPVRHTTEVLSVAVGSLDLDYEGDKRRVRRHSDWVSLCVTRKKSEIIRRLLPSVYQRLPLLSNNNPSGVPGTLKFHETTSR